MSTELTMLAWTIVLALVQIVGAAQFSVAAHGLAWGVGPRDGTPPGRMSVIGGRVERAAKNMMETFPLAAAAILIAAVLGRSNAYTMWGAQIYFWARLVFLGLYVGGIPWIRTVVFLVSVVGILLVLFGATRA